MLTNIIMLSANNTNCSAYYLNSQWGCGDSIINVCQNAAPLFLSIAYLLTAFSVSVFSNSVSRTKFIAVLMVTFCDFYGMVLSNSGGPQIHGLRHAFGHAADSSLMESGFPLQRMS